LAVFSGLTGVGTLITGLLREDERVIWAPIAAVSLAVVLLFIPDRRVVLGSLLAVVLIGTGLACGVLFHSQISSFFESSENQHAPVVSSHTTAPQAFKPEETGDISVKADDEDGDFICFEFQAERGDVTAGKCSGPIVGYSAPAEGGFDTIKVSASDGEHTTVYEFDIPVQDD
jgi:hypothetical protein